MVLPFLLLTQNNSWRIISPIATVPRVGRRLTAWRSLGRRRHIHRLWSNSSAGVLWSAYLLDIPCLESALDFMNWTGLLLYYLLSIQPSFSYIFILRAIKQPLANFSFLVLLTIVANCIPQRGGYFRRITWAWLTLLTCRLRHREQLECERLHFFRLHLSACFILSFY